MVIKRLKSKFLVLLVLVLALAGCEFMQSLYGEEGVSYVPLGDVPVEGEEEQEDMPEIEIIEEEPETEEDDIEVVEVDIDELDEEEEQEVEEEIEEELEEPSEDAIVIISEETELISLEPEANDPDADTLQYTYTSPLDEDGEWQTDYGDAGEYTVTVTVSDGELTNSREVLLIVNKKEEAPTINRFSPEQTEIEIMETESVDFSVSANDLNDDPLSYSWKLDGESVSDSTSFDYESDYDDSGAHTVKLDISDQTSTVTQLWSLSVENVNREPILEEIEDISVQETDTITIEPEATDPDGDEITFTISEPIGDDGVWETDYDSAGEYSVTVTASDGTDEVSQEVSVDVANVNRAPVITGISKG